MAYMVLFSALYSHWAAAIPLPESGQNVEISMHHNMNHQGMMMGDMTMSGSMHIVAMTQDLPKMSYAHYCPYCHGPCDYDMDTCHVIYPVADLVMQEFHFAVPSEMPVFALQTTLPVAPTSKHIRPPKFA
ncbi:hypothetical protein [Hydrogenovibrio marinus]|uniref:DUF2946 domain-containing protein n=1 Tax=Hydrogenovibrio marinus TaxID=28885 RepID=A0A066ZQP0_HYDMR|nr:hypothetical protein [Hydrogenovibrio marinus]KDN96118.1 hypothetical protein EI16_07465 [Hydrogenovibrio marinus]BBN60705.1 hypothetical protein HVMH_2299 [Hydrogenovibrio marinus]